jgi:hypothetical protein
LKIPKVGADHESKSFELAPATPTAWWQRVQGILGAVAFHSRRVTSPRPVLCVGLKSSASTWVFNVVVEILRASRGDISQMSRTVSPGAAFEPGGVMSFYSDAIEAFPEGAEHAGYLVIKTHKPARSLRYLAGAGGAKVLISVREPRDAVASLMQRFDLPFETVLRDFKLSAQHIIAIARGRPFLLLRYEDRFYENLEGVASVAKFLGVRLNRSKIELIARELSAEEIALKIEQLKADGVLGPRPDANEFDRRTHLHAGHLGDGSIGKHAALTLQQQDSVLLALRDFCRTFGYSARRAQHITPSDDH